MLSGLPPELAVLCRIFPAFSKPNIANRTRLSDGARSRRIAVELLDTRRKVSESSG